MKKIAFIPARYSSSRFPGKVLSIIHGKPMIQVVYEGLKRTGLFDDILVLTDDEKVLKAVQGFNAKVIMTSKECNSGTERIISSDLYRDADIILNIQADEPMVHKKHIELLITGLENGICDVSTLCYKIDDKDLLFDFNTVKVVPDRNNYALYFSRQAIPAFRDLPFDQWMDQGSYYQHIGMYGFTSASLDKIKEMEDSYLEKQESLEQLKWIDYGLKIRCLETFTKTVGIDTPEDLDFYISNFK